MKLYQNCLTVAVLSFISASAFAFGPGNMPSVPSGWTLKESYANILIYQKTGEDTFVQIIDVRGGAKVRFINPGLNTSTNPWSFYRYSLSTLWNNAGNRTSMVNGQFFNGANNPTLLSFGVRKDWSILTYGADPASSYSLKQIDFIDGNGVIIRQPATASTLSMTNSGANAIIGLDARENRSSTWSIGRLYFCSVVPASPSKWLLTMSAKNLTQADANTRLASWGCGTSNTVMMDGSGSSQLQTLGNLQMYGWSLPGYADQRALPQAIAFYNYGVNRLSPPGLNLT